LHPGNLRFPGLNGGNKMKKIGYWLDDETSEPHIEDIEELIA
jgi:hypothetical protein